MGVGKNGAGGLGEGLCLVAPRKILEAKEDGAGEIGGFDAVGINDENVGCAEEAENAADFIAKRSGSDDGSLEGCARRREKRRFRRGWSNRSMVIVNVTIGRGIRGSGYATLTSDFNSRRIQ